jgi:hypothetical protein
MVVEGAVQQDLINLSSHRLRRPPAAVHSVLQNHKVSGHLSHHLQGSAARAYNLLHPISNIWYEQELYSQPPAVAIQ